MELKKEYNKILTNFDCSICGFFSVYILPTRRDNYCKEVTDLAVSLLLGWGKFKTKFVDEVFVLLKNKTPQNRPCSYSLRPEGEGCNSLKRSVRSWPQCTMNLRRVSAESMRLEGSIIRSWNPSSFFVQIEVSLMSHTVPISAVQWNDSVLHIYTFFFKKILFSIMVCPGRLDIVPCAIEGNLLFIHSKY